MKQFLSRLKVNPDTLADLIGAGAIIGTALAGFWIAHAVGFPTGGDQLMGAV